MHRMTYQLVRLVSMYSSPTGTTIFYHMSLRQSASTPVRLGGPTTTPPPMTQVSAFLCLYVEL